MSSITFKSFNNMLLEFVTELSETFDEYTDLSKAKSTLTGVLSLDESTEVPLNSFYGMFAEHADLVMSKDKSLMSACKMPFLESFDMEKAYEESDEQTRSAIWGYVQQLFITATTVKTLTPEMFKSIEALADTCLSQVKDGSVTEDEAKNPLYILQQMQSNPEIMKAIEDAQGT